MSEERVTNATTGGEKGSKLARHDLIPSGPLTQLAEMYGHGAKKYAARNWERGYDWSLSYAALQRHAVAFWGGEDAIPQTPEGEDDDPTAGVNHLVAVAWHAFAMLEWMTTHPELDDRPKQPYHYRPGGKLVTVDYVAAVHRPACKIVRRVRGGTLVEWPNGIREILPDRVVDL